MLGPIEIGQIVSLHRSGRSINFIQKQTGHSRSTIRRYLSSETAQGAVSDDERQKNWLSMHREEIREQFFLAEGNCVVLQRNLKEEFNKNVHLRMLQRFCGSFRRELSKESAYIRYETAPGQQMQIDFGERDVIIAGEIVRIHFIACVLGYSRRIFVKAYPAENQTAWLNGIESAFCFFAGIPMAVVCDNSRCLVIEHKRRGETRLTENFRYFCDYWRVKPIACRPYHPQAKGKVERVVRYIKENALAGKEFCSLQELNHWLETWSRVYADKRKLADFAEGLKTPAERFWIERRYLQSLDGKPPIAGIREETRRVDGAGLIRVDNQHYRLPDSVRNSDVQILVDDRKIVVSQKGKLIEELDKATSVYRLKLQKEEISKQLSPLPDPQKQYLQNELQRSLSSYAEAAGGSWQ